MHLLRTRFKKEIVAEFLPPLRSTKREKVIIVCGGMPGSPHKGELLEFYARKGFWVFNPRYRGTWESGGKFLRRSPEKDIRDVIDSLPNGFTDFWSGKRYKVKPDKLYIFAGSFGGPAGILLTRDPRVTKVVAVSPVVDFRALIDFRALPKKPYGWLENFVKDAFGMAYRFRKKDWQDLGRGKFYNPATELEKVDGRKILIYHAKDDRLVRPKEVIYFAKKTGGRLKLLRSGGHLSTRMLILPRFYREIRQFINSRT